MSRRIAYLSFVVVFFLISGCGPDLVPGPGAAGYCHPTQLCFSVTNQGNRDAGRSTARVEFYPGGAVGVLTPPLVAGESKSFCVDLPPGVTSPFKFKVVVDTANEVKETNEDNNIVEGSCPP